jgi:uncharacterized protein
MIRKQFQVEKEGEWLTINTGTVDRDRDRVLPSGAVLENYMANPVVMWGHNYRDPWALIGRAADLEVTETGIRSRPEFRAPASESDPMHIIQALWDGGLVRAASIGFNPLEWNDNERGGYDFTRWELLEWSLVPIPANQEALRLAVKGIDEQPANPQFFTEEGVREAYRQRWGDRDPQDVIAEILREQGDKGIDGREPDGDGVEDSAASEGDGGAMKQADPDAGPDVDATTAAGDDDDNGLSPEQCAALGETLGQFLKTILEAWK